VLLGTLLTLTVLTSVVDAKQDGTANKYDCPALYDSGKYTSAADCFASLEAGGNHNGHLLYNLGNALQQAGKTGEAILAYRRAQLYLPRDGDLIANLTSARNKARDDLPPPGEREAIAATLLAPYDSLSAAELLIAGTLCWALLFTLLTLRSWRDEDLVSVPMVLLAILALLALSGHLARSYQVSEQPTGVVLSEEVTLRSGRDLRSVELARLHEGAELDVLAEEDDWTQVRLSTGQKGWLPRPSVGLARFAPRADDR
jgi:tetratricopeptide (TPR) repeat protein